MASSRGCWWFGPEVVTEVVRNGRILNILLKVKDKCFLVVSMKGFEVKRGV